LTFCKFSVYLLEEIWKKHIGEIFMKHTLKTLLTTTVLTIPSVFGAGIPEADAQSGATPYTTATEAEQVAAEAELAAALAAAKNDFEIFFDKLAVAEKAAKQAGPESEAFLEKKVEGFPMQLAEALKEIAKGAAKK
jgi:hypothetical protein